jgi:hypothetical protein
MEMAETWARRAYQTDPSASSCLHLLRPLLRTKNVSEGFSFFLTFLLAFLAFAASVYSPNTFSFNNHAALSIFKRLMTVKSIRAEELAVLAEESMQVKSIVLAISPFSSRLLCILTTHAHT